jgi:hypothetical protein
LPQTAEAVALASRRKDIMRAAAGPVGREGAAANVIDEIDRDAIQANWL